MVKKWVKVVKSGKILKFWLDRFFFSKINILMKIQHFDDSSHLINRDHDSWCIRVKPSRPNIGMVWYNDETEYRGGPPREVLSEFDSTISGLSIMKAREFEKSKIEGWKIPKTETNSKTLRILRTLRILELSKSKNIEFYTLKIFTLTMTS